MKTGELRRQDREAWVAKVRDAVTVADGLLEPAAKALAVRPITLHRWLKERELHAVPIRGDHWAVNYAHRAVRLVRAGEAIDIDVGIVPLLEATWSMKPFSPETCCSCESWPEDGPDHGKVQLGFNLAAGAWLWLEALDRLDGWCGDDADENTAVFVRDDWSLHIGALSVREPFLRAWVYFPRDELADVTACLRRR